MIRLVSGAGIRTHTLESTYLPNLLSKPPDQGYFKYGPNPASFCLFSSFSQYNDKFSTKFDSKSLDGVFGIRTRDQSLVGADKSTKLWRPTTKGFVWI